MGNATDMSTLPRLIGAEPADEQDYSELSSSRLGKALTVNGKLESDGEIRIYGSVLGQINAVRLIVGRGACVEGDVIAKNVHIGGKLIGRVFAPKVALDSTADITGRIFHNTADIAKGAVIDGRMPWRPLNFFEELKQPPEKQS
jgi:cytoskeletal protein CcmA (bactofilin family)